AKTLDKEKKAALAQVDKEKDKNKELSKDLAEAKEAEAKLAKAAADIREKLRKEKYLDPKHSSNEKVLAALDKALKQSVSPLVKNPKVMLEHWQNVLNNAGERVAGEVAVQAGRDAEWALDPKQGSDAETKAKARYILGLAEWYKKDYARA